MGSGVYVWISLKREKTPLTSQSSDVSRGRKENKFRWIADEGICEDVFDFLRKMKTELEVKWAEGT